MNIIHTKIQYEVAFFFNDLCVYIQTDSYSQHDNINYNSRTVTIVI